MKGLTQCIRTKAAIGCLIGLVFGVSASAEPLVEGWVRLDSGQPVPGAQVLLFDLSDLRIDPLAAITDESGYFTLARTALPEQFELGANYPNPFNPSTIIPYQLPTAMHVRLEVFNILGQRVATLVDGERPAGFHTAGWNATDAAGQAVAAGVYLYRLSGRRGQIVRSMMLIDGQAGMASAGPTGLEVGRRRGRGSDGSLWADRIGCGSGSLRRSGPPGGGGHGSAECGGRSAGQHSSAKVASGTISGLTLSSDQPGTLVITWVAASHAYRLPGQLGKVERQLSRLHGKRRQRISDD